MTRVDSHPPKAEFLSIWCQSKVKWFKDATQSRLLNTNAPNMSPPPPPPLGIVSRSSVFLDYIHPRVQFSRSDQPTLLRSFDVSPFGLFLLRAFGACSPGLKVPNHFYVSIPWLWCTAWEARSPSVGVLGGNGASLGAQVESAASAASGGRIGHSGQLF